MSEEHSIGLSDNLEDIQHYISSSLPITTDNVNYLNSELDDDDISDDEDDEDRPIQREIRSNLQGTDYNSVKLLKHAPNSDFSYFEQDNLTEEEYGISTPIHFTPSLQLEVEKSKTVNKFLFEQRNEESIKDIFARNCLRLFNGEFTVLKTINEKEKLDVKPNNVLPTNLMYHENGRDTFEFSSKRSTSHPTDFLEEQLQIFMKCHRFRLEAGEIEPHFLSLELINIKTKCKLSERFYFTLSSYNIINNFYDELEIKKQLAKQTGQAPKALFSLSNISSKEVNLDGVYAVLFVYKTLQGSSYDQIVKNYNAGKKNHTLLKEGQGECQEFEQKNYNNFLEEFQGLKGFKEPFLFSFCPLKETGIHAMNWFLPMDILFQQMSANVLQPAENDFNENNILATSTKKQASYVDSVCEVITQCNDAPIYFFTPLNSSESNTKEELQVACDPSKSKSNLKKLKPIPGYMVFETFKFNLKKFKSDAVERVLLCGSDNERPLTNSPTVSLEEIVQKIQLRNGSILYPKDSTQEKELQKYVKSTCLEDDYQSFKVEEHFEKLPKFPHFDFNHLLFIAPIALNIEKLKIDNLSELEIDQATIENLQLKKFKSKNIVVKVEFMENENRPAPRIISPITNALSSEIYCNVTFDGEKIIRFIDEIKIALPLPIENEHHLVFSFCHLAIEKAGAKRKKTLDSTGKVHSICFGKSILPLKDIVDEHCSKMSDFNYSYNLPIYQKLPKAYLSLARNLSLSGQNENPLIRKYDSKKNFFVVNSRVSSTIYPNEKLLLQFFSDCAPFISIVKDGDVEGQSKELSRAIKDCRKSIENLMKVPFSRVVSHYTLILDMLLSVMCRIPDVLHTFVNESENQMATSTSSNRNSTLLGSNTSPSFNESSLVGSSEDEFMKSIAGRFGLGSGMDMSVTGTSPSGGSSLMSNKSIRNSIMAAKRKSSLIGGGMTQNASISPTVTTTSSSGTGGKRFSFKNIVKRKSKDLSEESNSPPLDSSPVTPTKRIAQPGEEGFNLVEYLKAQAENEQQQQQQQEQLNSNQHLRRKVEGKSPSGKNNDSSIKKRFSVFGDKLFHRKDSKVVDPIKSASEANIVEDKRTSDKSNIGTSRKSITFSAANKEDEGVDLSDFLGATMTLFELQKTVFQALVAMLKGAAMITDTSDRNNRLLNTYVNYIFKDVIMTQSPVWSNLTELWGEVLSKADDTLTISTNDESGENAALAAVFQGMDQTPRATTSNRNTMRKSIQDIFSRTGSGDANDTSSNHNSRNRNSYSMNMSLFAFSSPCYFESLNFVWFFLSLILKSYLLSQRDKAARRSHMSDVEYSLLSNHDKELIANDYGYKFTTNLKELISCLAEKVISYKEDFGNYFISQQINNQLSFFFRDLFSCGEVKPEFVFELMELYFREIMVKKPVTPSTVKLGGEFLQILSDCPNFIELNLSIFHPKEYVYNESMICPPIKLITNLTRDSIVHMKNETDLHSACLRVIRYLLTKEDYLYLSEENPNKKKFELVARIYFPYLLMLLNNLTSLQFIQDTTYKQHLKCAFWILANLNNTFLENWIKNSTPLLLGSLLKLVSLYIDVFEFKNREKFDIYSLKVFEMILAKLNTYLFSRISTIVENKHDDPKMFEPNHKDISSFIKMEIRDNEGSKYHYKADMTDRELVGYTMFALARFLQKLISRPKHINIEMEEETEKILKQYIVLFTPVFRSNYNSTYWKWLYGSLLSGTEITLQTIQQKLKAEQPTNDTPSKRLMTELENVYKNDIITLDKLSKLFDESKNSNDEVVLDEEGKVKAATLNRLVERICNQSTVGDTKFTDTFFQTYRSFSTPDILLNSMMSYFEFHLLADAGKDMNNKNVTILRLLNSIRLWIQTHSYDFNNYLLASMIYFLYYQVGRLCVSNEETSSGFINIANKIKERIENNLLRNGESSEKYEKMFSRERPAPKYPAKWDKENENRKFNIIYWDAFEIARQITLIEYNIFSAIEPKEFFGLGWTKKDKTLRAPNIVHLTEQFNNMSAFVASDIVKEDVLKKRAKKLKQWINTAWECKNLNNLNGCNAIISALNNSGVHRLKKTWELVQKKGMELSKFQQLNDLVSMTSSYKNMREHIQNCGQALPYIGIYLTDMVFIEDGNKDIITVNKDNSELQLINFAKRRKIAEVIDKIKTQQQTLYDFIPIPYLQQKFDFSNMGEEEKKEVLWTEDKLWNKSLVIEPRQ
ncbi:hypothetical protein ABK040_014956 [Willaertia magna]